MTQFINLLVLFACVCVAFSEEEYPYESSRINRPSYQRKLQARRKGPTMPAKGWEMCCEAEFQVVPNMEHSYVWPMETPERNYFVVSGMKILYSTAHDSLQFKVVEPNLEDNKISITGDKLLDYMRFEKSEEIFVSRKTWQERSEQPNESSLKNVFILDIFEIPEGESFSCQTEKDDQFCYLVMPNPRVNRIALQIQKHKRLGPQTWTKLFMMIRQSKWAAENGITDDSVITIGLVSFWYHYLFISNVIENGRNDLVGVSDYMMEAARKVLGLAPPGVSRAIAWRIQRQFTTSRFNLKQQSVLDLYPDRGGYVTGCQVAHIVNSLINGQMTKVIDETPVVLIFDIFAHGGQGADMKVGPTKIVKKEVIRTFKSMLKSIVVIEAIHHKLQQEFFTKLDPNNIAGADKENFMVWLEIAVGVEVENLVDAGGHFAATISDFRMNKGVSKVKPADYCSPSMVDAKGQPIKQDDIPNIF